MRRAPARGAGLARPARRTRSPPCSASTPHPGSSVAGRGRSRPSSLLAAAIGRRRPVEATSRDVAVARRRAEPRGAMHWPARPDQPASHDQPHDLGSRRHRRAAARHATSNRRGRRRPGLPPNAPLRDGTDLTAAAALALFEDQLASRQIDVAARELKKTGPQLLHDRLGRPREQRGRRRPACASTIRRSCTTGPAAS